MDEKSTGIDKSDSEEIEISQLDMGAAVQAALFQDTTVRGPEWFKAAVAQKASEAKSAPGALGFDPKSPEAKRADEAKRREEDMAELASTVAQLQEQERERERVEWSRTKSTVGGLTLTGAEWAKLAERLRDDEDLRDRILAAFKARGMSDQEAEARLERGRQVAEISAIPLSQRTPEQRETIELAEADKSFKTDMAVISKVSSDQSSDAKTSLSANFDNAASGLPTSSKVDRVPEASMPVPAAPGP